MRSGFFLGGAVLYLETHFNQFRKKYNLLVVLGPTASGKTRLAVALARALGAEIISADSRQVYRGLDIGTGKDVSEYSGEWGTIPFHLIDVIDPSEEFNVFAFQEGFSSAFREITGRGAFPIMAGGTGLYLDSVLRGYRMEQVPENSKLREELENEEMDSLRVRLETLNPDLHNKTDFLDRKRALRAIEIAEFRKDASGRSDLPELSPFVIGIHPLREELRAKITARLAERLNAGMVDEVRRLHEGGVSWQRIDALGLEYRYVALYLRKELGFDAMFSLLNTKIHQFAKRQMTWFRKMEKCGVTIHWLTCPDEVMALDLIAMNSDG
jgi:tRNA dimethylallyltransferase